MKTGSTTIIEKTFGGKLNQAAIDALRRVAERRRYPAGTVLCRQGEVEHTFYIVVEGRVAAEQTLPNGEARLLGVMKENDYFGEMSLIDDTPRMASCIAMTPTIVLEITEDVFDRLMEENPSMAYSITQSILASIRNLDRLTIEELRQKNEALAQAYEELKAAQAKLVEKERLEKELELAADVQISLLPGQLPQLPGYGFGAYLSPARRVGGDFYDVIVLDGEHVALLIADVADKGFHAALIMAVTRTLFRQAARQLQHPAPVAQAVHRGMLDVAAGSDVFVTAVYGVLHSESGRFTYVRAGHERPLLARANHPVQTLDGGNRFLGMMPNLHLDEFTMTFRPGDRLLLFSDGVPDTMNSAGERYGSERLKTALHDHRQQPAQALVEAIVHDIHRFSQDAAAFDDLTLLAVEAKS